MVYVKELSFSEMENSYETLSNGKSRDPSLQIIRHPSYQSCSKLSLPWLDIKVFYVRISNFLVDESTPESLSVNHIPLSPDTILEVNGARCKIHSEGISCVLRRDRVDKKAEEATFVSTANVRLTGSVKFEVFDRDNLVLSGILEMSNKNGLNRESKNNVRIWSMNCEPVMSAYTGFLKGKQIVGSESLPPTIEVYVAGSFSGTPVILTKTIQLSLRKKHMRNGMLGTIPEYEAAGNQEHATSELDQQIVEYRNYKMATEEDYSNSGSSLYWRNGEEYMEGEDGELSWFNAGVRVGVGLGLGICLGVGIGVGLLVRTYQTTSRTFKRRLL